MAKVLLSSLPRLRGEGVLTSVIAEDILKSWLVVCTLSPASKQIPVQKSDALKNVDPIARISYMLSKPLALGNWASWELWTFVLERVALQKDPSQGKVKGMKALDKTSNLQFLFS
jgi:hypothetical protein